MSRVKGKARLSGTRKFKKPTLDAAQKDAARTPQHIPLAELVRRARVECVAHRAVPSDPLGRWWLQGPSA
jgi:hypothetical protein